MEVYTRVTEQILEQLRAGVVPWVKPWSVTATTAGARNREYPHNIVSNRDYNGGNVFLLMLTAMTNRYPTGAWASYKQIKERGGQVRKGERSTIIVWLDRVVVKDKTSADPDAKKVIPLLKTFSVFNVAQADWTRDPFGKIEDEDGSDETTAYPDADATVEATGAKITYEGSRAFYAPGPDVIRMPKRKTFKKESGFHGTRFHELTHWTGNGARCARDLKNGYGSPEYAFEELVAELGAAFLCAKHGIDSSLREDHAAYIGHWIKALEDHDDAFYKAASLAQKAADFILSAAEVAEMEVAA